jgi:hypothetical protein
MAYSSQPPLAAQGGRCRRDIHNGGQSPRSMWFRLILIIDEIVRHWRRSVERGDQRRWFIPCRRQYKSGQQHIAFR